MVLKVNPHEFNGFDSDWLQRLSMTLYEALFECYAGLVVSLLTILLQGVSMLGELCGW